MLLSARGNKKASWNTPVKELHGINCGLIPEHRSPSTCAVDVWEHHERARLVLPLRNCVVCDPADKPQRPFGTDEQPLDDLDWVRCGKVNKGIDAVACGAFDCKLAADEVGQLPIVLHSDWVIGTSLKLSHLITIKLVHS